MKKNKIIYTALVLFLTAQIALGQKSSGSKTSFSFKAGINLTSVTATADGEKVKDNSLKSGVNAGFYADVMLGKNFYFEPGLIVTSKGTVNKGSITKTTISGVYAEVPLNFVYKSKGNNGGFILGAGPYISYGIAGTVKERNNGYKETSLKFKSKTALGFNYNKNVYYLQPFDGGLGMLIGYQSKAGIIFQLSAQAGIVNETLNLNGVQIEASKYKNYGFGFSVGYSF